MRTCVDTTSHSLSSHPSPKNSRSKVYWRHPSSLWRQMILINKKLLYDKLVRWLIATSWGWMDLRKKRMDGPIVWPTSSFGHGHCTAGQWAVVHKPIITLQIITTTTIIKWYGKTSSFSGLLLLHRSWGSSRVILKVRQAILLCYGLMDGPR